MSLTAFIIKFAAPRPKIENFERYLFIGPHPDDIEIGAGATAAKLAALGKKVSFLICIDGRYGGNAAPEDELVDIRKKEAIASAKMLGVSDVHFLDLCDGGFYSEDELTEKMARVIGQVKPDVILSVDPDVTSEVHVDHLRVGNAAKRLAYFAPFENIMARYNAQTAPVKALALFMTAKPTGFVKTGKYFKQQLKSIFECHLSQFPEGSPEGEAIRLYLTLRAREYGIRNFTSAAEGFRVLGVTHMHCLPEAGK